MQCKIAIITTHPIQYNAPWFKKLNLEPHITVKVFYTWSQSKGSVKDQVFGKDVAWDVPLLDGYEYEFVNNESKDPGTHHKMGIVCPELIPKIQRFKPNKILVFGWYLKSHFDVMRYFKGKSAVWFRGDSTMLDDSFIVKAILRKLFLKYVYQFIDKALYVGSNNKKYFLQLGIKPKNMIFANHAIDNDRFFDSLHSTYETKAIKWRTNLGIVESDTVILFSGKYQEKKQPLLLLTAIQNVNKNLTKPLKLIFVGSGPQESLLRLFASDDENIFILPFQNQSLMPVVYRLGNIFCLPSKGPGETWGLAVNEAMACSRPVIVSDKVGCAIDLVNDSNGFIFPNQNSSRLEQILNRLSNDTLKIMGLRSKEIISNWNFDNIVKSIKDNI